MESIKYNLVAALTTTGLSLSVMAADITVAYNVEPISLDPYERRSDISLQLSHLVFDPLVRYTQKLDFEPRLATSWKRIDDKTFRFRLRKGVKFHSGNEMTADDVVWTFNRLKSSGSFKDLFAIYEEVEKIDDYTVDLVSSKASPLVLQAATYIFPMDSKFYSGLAEVDKEELVMTDDTSSIVTTSGTGPFVIAYHEFGEKMGFKRFEQYWDTNSKGNVDKLTLVSIEEDGARAAALLSGDVDIIAPVAPTTYKRIKQSKGVDLATLPSTQVITFQMNQKTQLAFRDVRVRQAIVHAINNEGIAKKLMKGFATPTGQLGFEGYAGYDKELKPRYNLKKAKKLMKQAGYADGFSLTMIAPNNQYTNDAKIAQSVAAMLSKIRIKIELKTMPKELYWDEFDKCETNMLMIGWQSEDSVGFSESLIMTRNEDSGGGKYNCGHYSNTEVDRLVKESNLEGDPAKRRKVLQQVEAILYNEAAFVPLHWQNLVWGVKSEVDIQPVINSMDYVYFGDLVVR